MSRAIKLTLKVLLWLVGGIIALLLLLVGYIELRWNAPNDRPAPILKAPTDSLTIARGEYIFKYQAQCWGCHQNPSRDANAPPAGGLLFDLTKAGPGFGKWYSRNLTPDSETGIGAWTDGEIVQALREGVRKDRSPMFPVMPIDWYNGMADDDVLAVVAYLRSLQPVRNRVPASEPSLAAKALFTFKIMRPKEPITARIVAPARAATPEYGKYLANHLAECADCHTPRNLQDGSFFLDSLFAGSSFQFEGMVSAFARNITPDRETGIGSWSEEQFLDAVTMGVRPDTTVLAYHMPYAYYKSWEPDDLRAVYLYLKTVTAWKRTVPPLVYDSLFKTSHGIDKGRMLFKIRCQVCHGADGSGAQPTKVRLTEVVASLSDDDLKGFISSGQMNLKMPAFGKTLAAEDIDNLIAFMRTWDKKGEGTN